LLSENTKSAQTQASIDWSSCESPSFNNVFNMQILDCPIGPNHSPYLIAELSGNHNGELERALQIVDAAAKTGANALKLQTYSAQSMTLNLRMPGFVIDDPKSLWAGRQLYELYQEAATPYEWHKPIMERAASHGMACFSTPFDAHAVEFLESLNVPAYKIASFELVDLPLIRLAAQTGKPLIMSTGMAKLSEIEEAVATARAAGAKDIVLLKCTSTYPATPEFTNIRTIAHLREAFGCEVGLSDHTMGCGVAVGAVALGATMIEKHFTLRRADGGVDSAFSMEPEEFAMLRTEVDRVHKALGQVHYGPTAAEVKSLGFRRSIYISADVKAGDRLGPHNLRCVRPGYGLPPKFWDQLQGLAVGSDAPAGTPMSWQLLSR
jgi:pseudaminic acid synthase